MIEGGDKRTSQAVRDLANEVQKLHDHREYNPKFHRGDSPDEKKMRKDLVMLKDRGKLDQSEVQEIQRAIRTHIPKKKRVIHGDAHLGNFMYSDSGVLYMIDTDNAQISDPHADLGKIVEAIGQLEEEGKINESISNSLKDLFLDIYQGEEKEALDLFRLRTPLIRVKYEDSGGHSRVKKAIGRIRDSKLESTVTTSIIVLSLALLAVNGSISGLVSLEKGSTPNILSSSLIILAILAVSIYFILSKRTKNKKKLKS